MTDGELWFQPPPDDDELGQVGENFESVYEEDDGYDFGNDDESVYHIEPIPIGITARNAFSDVRDSTESTASKMTTIPLLTPSYLTPTEWGDFTKWVSEHPGWTVKRREASDQDKLEHGQPRMCQCYWVDAVYSPPPPASSSSSSSSSPRAKRSRPSSAEPGAATPLHKEHAPESKPRYAFSAAALFGGYDPEEHKRQFGLATSEQQQQQQQQQQPGAAEFGNAACVGGPSVPPKTPSPPLAKFPSAPATLARSSSSSATAGRNKARARSPRTGDGEDFDDNNPAPKPQPSSVTRTRVTPQRGSSASVSDLLGSSGGRGMTAQQEFKALVEAAKANTSMGVAADLANAAHTFATCGGAGTVKNSTPIHRAAGAFTSTPSSSAGGGVPQEQAAAIVGAAAALASEGAAAAAIEWTAPAFESNRSSNNSSRNSNCEASSSSGSSGEEFASEFASEFQTAGAKQHTLAVTRSTSNQALGVDVYAPRDVDSMSLGRVAVASVVRQGAADRAGLKAGDVLQSMHGHSVKVDSGSACLPGGGLGATLTLLRSLPPCFQVVVFRCE